MNTPALPNRPPELVELETRRTVIRAERQEVQDGLARLEIEAFEQNQRGDDSLESIAERLATGEISTAPREVLPEEIDVKRSRLALLQRAEQKVAVLTAEQRDRHNRNIAKAWRPQHREAGRRIARALRELVDANRAEQQIRDRAPAGQLVAMDFPGVGQLGAAGGPAKFWLEHAERHGYLADEDELKTQFPAAAL